MSKIRIISVPRQLLPTIGTVRRKGFEIMGDDEYQAAVAAFIHAKGIKRCPTACALPTQGTVAATDRAALLLLSRSATQ